MTNIQFGLRELDKRFIIDVVFFYNVINDQIRLRLDSRIQFSRELLERICSERYSYSKFCYLLFKA